MVSGSAMSVGVVGVPDYQFVWLRDKRYPTALVIPVLNEKGRLDGQLLELMTLNLPVDVVIADGGSTDGSSDVELLKSLGVSSLLTKKGSGRLSAQLRMAIHFCGIVGYESIVTMDGNGKDNPRGISRILEALDEGFSFVQGSRFLRGGKAINTPSYRYLAIRLIHAPLTSLGARYWFTDSTNGFRGMSAEFLASPEVDPLRDQFDSYELLAYLPIRAGRLNLPITEVPVERAYPSSGMTPTKIHGVRLHVKLFLILIKSIAGIYNPRR